jgi:hypothetical protein
VAFAVAEVIYEVFCPETEGCDVSLDGDGRAPCDDTEVGDELGGIPALTPHPARATTDISAMSAMDPFLISCPPQCDCLLLSVCHNAHEGFEVTVDRP